MTRTSGRLVSRRSVIKGGLAIAAGTGLAIAGTGPASASQSGAQLCDNPGDSAGAQGLGSGDLCIPYFREHDGTWGYVFGDSWAGIQQTGRYLGSPVMLYQSSFDSSGGTPISFTCAMPTGGQANQLFDYGHNVDNGFGTE